MIKKIGATFTILCLIALLYTCVHSSNKIDEERNWWEDDGCEEDSKTELWECEKP